MCILCVVQRWSRRVASMLPYLVIPLMLLWALSHFLPPGFRFEATSPRIACAAVLLLTLLWYEFLLPRLSAWRARRSARLREIRREQALELQKLRKTATRRCRNCLSPYRDQNPGGGGRFMCSNCGHVSKRPVLELPGRNGNFSEKNGWFCTQFLSHESGNNNGYWIEDTNNNNDNNSNNNAFSLGCKIGKIFAFFYIFFKWVCRRVFGFGSSGDNGSGDNDSKRNKRGENGGNLQESKVEKAKRKAEEKKMAKLEREMLEEEERKQREEVLRLVEERRKLRDEKLEAEEKSKGATPIGEREGKKEHDKKKEKRRENQNQKDKLSNKSNSDCEDVDKKGKNIGTGTGISTNKANNNSQMLQQNGVNRRKYFRGFSGASFFGGSNQNSSTTISTNTNSTNSTSVNVNKGINVNKSNNVGSSNNNQSHVVKRDAQNGTGTVHNVVPNGDETKINRPAQTEQQQQVPNPNPNPKQQQVPAPKKAWHQLFKRSNPVTPSPNPNFPTPTLIQNPNQTLTLNNNSSIDTYIAPPNNYFNPTTQPSLFKPPPPSFPLNPTYTNPFTTTTNLPYHHPIYKSPPIPDELDLFEDPSFDPDAIALLGPISESLGGGNLSNGFVKLNKPSPIESPIARPRTHSPHKNNSSNNNNNNSLIRDEPGAWTLWGAPLTQNALGSVGTLNSSPRHVRGVGPVGHMPLVGANPVQNGGPGDSLFLPHNLMGRFPGTDVNSPDMSPTQHWPKKEWMMNEAAKSSSPRAESLFSTDPVVQFNQKDSK